MMYGRARGQDTEAIRKDFNIVLISQDKKFFTSELIKVIQDAIPLTYTSGQCVDSEQFLRVHSYHVGCAVSLLSITNSGLIAGGQNSSKERQTVFFTAVNPMNKNHKEPQQLDLTKPRLALYKQKWKRHQDTVC